MKTKGRARGFTLIELLVVITIIAMLAAGAYAGYGALMPGIRAKQASSQATTIHKWLTTYALDQGGAYPTGDSANLAYRELFKMNIGADEKQFAIPNDPYHKPAKDQRPDGDIGREPDFAQALETGENAFAYVSGLSNSSLGRLPLIANGFAGQPGVWSKNKTEKGGVFQGKYGVVCRVSGSSSAHDLSDDLMVKERQGGQDVNIFSEGFSPDEPFTVVNPM
jgi:prepilin-type N-terminal cleavage/methylation domain-containing protein